MEKLTYHAKWKKRSSRLTALGDYRTVFYKSLTGGFRPEPSKCEHQ